MPVSSIAGLIFTRGANRPEERFPPSVPEVAEKEHHERLWLGALDDPHCHVRAFERSQRFALLPAQLERLSVMGVWGVRVASMSTNALSLGFLALHDLPLAVEVEHHRRYVEVRAHLLGYPQLTPVLVLAAGGVESEHDQISIELS